MNEISGNSKKRKANSPVVGREKERREEENMTTNQATDKALTTSLIGREKERADSVASLNSYASVASRTGQYVDKQTRKPIFTTIKPEGAFRDEIVVEIQTLDEQPFRGTITTKEARKTIFEGILGFEQKDLMGFYFAYSSCPIVTFKLSSQFNIDNLEHIQNFEMQRKSKVRNEERTSTLKCKIRGIRSRHQSSVRDYLDEGVRWVKIEGCEYRLEEKQIVEWLSHFGEIKSKISEDTHEESDNLPPVGNGIYSVKMKLTNDIPQLIPMHGKRARLYYRGIVKKYTNCFGTHQRKNCKEKKVTWFSYIKEFSRIYPEIPGDWYGKWKNLIERVSPEEDQEKTLREEDISSSNLSGSWTSQTRRGHNIEIQSQMASEETNSLKNENDKGNLEEREEEDITKDRNENKNENEMEDTTKDDEINRLVKGLIAAGISPKMLKKSIKAEKTEIKTRKGGLKLGRGRGRGVGRGDQY